METWNIDIALLPSQLTAQTALLLVHNVGNVIDVPTLISQYGSDIIVEDNCEGFLGKYNNQYWEKHVEPFHGKKPFRSC